MKKLMITIPEPCHVGWDQMQAEKNGRYCGSCQKTVIDFTAMKDQEILTYLATQNNICGHFRKSQVNRILVNQGAVSSKKIHWPSVAAMIVAGIFIPAVMAGAPAIFPQEQLSSVNEEEKSEKVPAPSKDSLVTITVSVKDMYTGAPIPGAKVEIKGTGGFETNNEGMLSVEILVINIPETLEILIKAEGYMNMETTLLKTVLLAKTDRTFFLEDKNSLIDGGISPVRMD